jgi:hypothetical protein
VTKLLNTQSQKTWQQQADIVVSTANPVSTTLYTVLATTADVRIIGIGINVTWAVTQPSPLEIVVTVDGNPIVMSQTNPVSAGVYAPCFYDSTAAFLANGPGGNPALYRSFLLEGKSVTVQMRVTWAVTQPTPLVCRLKWAKLV